MQTTIAETNLGIGKLFRGKVRDCYQFEDASHGDVLLIVSTDRISAFDWVLPTPIPDKGKVLTGISAFWFKWLANSHEPLKHHLITTNVDDMNLPTSIDREPLRGRSMLVRASEVVPFECVVRGSLAGSGLLEYQRTGEICGERLPSGLRAGDRLPHPIFTPATKAENGHDENVSFATMSAALGTDLAHTLREQSIALFIRGAEYASDHGIVVADTKFEWGLAPDGNILLVDEILTPDSSRFWPSSAVGRGEVPDSFDKQFVRDWLESSGWDKKSPPPALPDDIVSKTQEKYLEAYSVLTGEKL